MKGAMIRGLGQAVAAAGGLEFMPVVEQVKNEDSDDTRLFIYFGATVSRSRSRPWFGERELAQLPGRPLAAASALVVPLAPGLDPGWAAAAAGDNLADEV